MPTGVLAAARALRTELAGFDPALLSGADCAALVEELAATEKACAGARATAAARAGACGAHRARGFGEAAEWLARTSGTTLGDARRALDTAAGLEALPAVAGALVAGELSLAQARELVGAEAESPGAAGDLLDVARAQPLAVLRDTARRRRLEAVEAGELHRRQRAARIFRHWRNDLGMVCGRFELPPETGIRLVNRLDAESDRVRRVARRGGSTEGRDAHAADALVAMLEGSSSGRAGRAEVIYVCDLRAARRGHAHPGEPCHIVGGGPVPVQIVADQVAQGTFVKALTHDGVRIDTVVHYGRHLPAELRTALELGAPPDFDGVTCADGCGRRYGLQWDHVDPVAHQGPTSFANLQPRCWPHHRDKTERDRKAGLLGGLDDPHHPP